MILYFFTGTLTISLIPKLYCYEQSALMEKPYGKLNGKFFVTIVLISFRQCTDEQKHRWTSANDTFYMQKFDIKADASQRYIAESQH